MDEKKPNSNPVRRCSFSLEGTPSPRGLTDEEAESRRQNCRRYTVDVCRCIKAWSPQYIPLASPFVVTSLIGPAAMHFGKGDETQGERMKMEQAILELTIVHFAKYWNVGSLMLRESHQTIPNRNNTARN